MEDNKLYGISYNYLLDGIRFGFYPPGSSLPPIADLCKVFHASKTTIHNTLKMLEKEGYVSLSQGRSAVVTYETTPEASWNYYNFYCNCTKEAVIDLRHMSEIIYPEIMFQGLKLCKGRDLDELEEIAGRMTPNSEYPFIEFFGRILEPLGNPLLHNLFQSTCIFSLCNAINHNSLDYSTPCVLRLRDSCRKMITACREHNYDEVKSLLPELYQLQTENTRQYYRTLPPPELPGSPVPFKWNHYTDRPMASFILAMDLIRDIYSSYDEMEYLPSLTALSSQHSLPVMTVRRAVKILNDLGITESINGKGTRVVIGSGRTNTVPSLDSPNIKRALPLYLQSVQILLLICQNIALDSFPSFSSNAMRTAAEHLREALASEDYYRTFGVCFRFLVLNSRSPSLREILGELMYLQYLGVPLNSQEPTDYRYDLASTRKLVRGLEERDADGFAEGLYGLVKDVYLAGREKLMANGFDEVGKLAVLGDGEMEI